MVEASDTAVVRFGRFEADFRCGELRHRGTKVKLQHQPFEALALLVERAGQVVTHQELAAVLWDDGIHVDFDQGIHTAIRKVRRALRDPVSRSRWIETVGRRGYRFIGKIENESARALGAEALRAPSARSPGPAAPAFVPGLTSFVGRELERRLLRERFDAAKSGQGQVILVTGEAGIGKSRLALELAADLGERPHTWLACRGSAQHQQTPFHPIIELLSLGSTGGSELPLAKRWDGFSRALARAGVKPEEGLPLVSTLLGLAVGELHPPLLASPEQARRQLLATLVAWLVGMAKLEPLVVVFEDLHWMDPSTLELLGLLCEAGASAPLLLLLTARPELRAPWPLRSHHTQVTLDRLGREQVEEMVRSLAPGSALPDDVIDAVVERTEGVPLFVEELTKAVLEAGSRLGALREIPASVRGSLLARLDRLGPAREAAQVGATIGREFSWALLRAVSELPDERLDAALSGLVGAELVYQRGLPPQATYTFKHALVQDAAYESLLESQRRDLHGRIADAFEQHLPERVASEPEEIARHCEKAGRSEQAIAHYQRAGERAMRRFADAEAIAHFRRAIELLRTLPENAERDRQEMHLQIALGAPLQQLRGHGSSESEEVYARALALSRQVGDAFEQFQALSGVGMFFRHNDAARALELGQELLELAERTGDTSQLLLAHSALGSPLFAQGEFSKALQHNEQAIALYDLIEHRSLHFVYGIDPGIISLCLASAALANLGYPARGLQHSEHAIELAREGAQPFSLGCALVWNAVSHASRGEPERVVERAEEAIAIATKGGFRIWLTMGLLCRGWALSLVSEAGDARLAIKELLRHLADGRGTGTTPHFAGGFFLLADAQRRLGRLDDAMRSLDTGLAWSARTHAPYYEAEMRRMQGEIGLLKDPATESEAESLFRRSIAIAQTQQAKLFELRAATSLARLWRDQGKPAEARALLRPVYDWFTEGFDTGDLKEAETLLAQLGG